MGVATVDDNVTLIQERDQFLDEVIDRLPGLDHQENLAGTLQRSYEVLQRMRSIEVKALASTFHEMVNLLNRTVIHDDMEALALHVQRQVLTHHRQSYKSDV